MYWEGDCFDERSISVWEYSGVSKKFRKGGILPPTHIKTLRCNNLLRSERAVKPIPTNPRIYRGRRKAAPAWERFVSMKLEVMYL
jgi:hypothetical protein